MRAHLLFAAGFAACAFLGRSAVDHVDDLLGIILVIGASQLALAAYTWSRLRVRDRRPPELLPKVGVVVCLKGAGPGLERCVRSILDQDYAGEVERVFVVPSEKDPGYAALRALLPAGGAGVRVLASERTSSRASAKSMDMLFGLEKLASGPEVVVFADADVEVPREWLGSLTAALEEPGAGCATTWHIQGRVAGPGSALRLMCLAGALPTFFLNPRPWGGSMAMRAEDVDSFGLRAVWARTLHDEGPVQEAVRARGLRTVFVPEAMGLTGDSYTAADLGRQLVRWMVLLKVYWPREWALMGLMFTCKCAVNLWTVWPVFCPRLFFWAAGLDIAYWLALLWILAARYGGRLRGMTPLLPAFPLIGAVLGPLFPFVSALSFAVSAPLRGFRWAGRRYRIRGPEDIEVTA